ncbi:MAG: hypothetical protein IAE90_16065 [Ignavibacteria bacterium]|mgnify:CR=1 FL=1|nr:hypothetical protein [Ignavibacteria bacterium]
MKKTIFFTIVFSIFFLVSGCSDDTPTNNTTGGPLGGLWRASEVQMVHAPSGSGQSAQMKAQLQLLGSLPAATVGWANLNFGSGRSWTQQTIGWQNLGKVKFIDNLVGSILPQDFMYNNPWYYLTTDGGSTWNQKNITGLSNLYTVSVSGSQVAYVLGQSTSYNVVLIKTTDGGSTWNQVFNFNTIGVSLYDIQFVNEMTGYAVGNEHICKTVNGGLNWSVQNNTLNSYNVRFINDQTGWVAGPTTSNNTSNLLRTIDGGNNWTTIPLNFLVYSFEFKDENLGFAAGTMNNKPVLQKTIDGGSSWTTILNMGVDWNQGFYFLNSNTGVAVDGSVLLRTEDGGLTWTEEFCDYYTDLSGVYLKDSHDGIVTADNGKIWSRTTTTNDNCWSLAGEIDNTSIANIVRSRDETYFSGGTYVVNDGNITFTVLGYSARGGDLDEHTIGGGTFTASGNLVLTLNFANDEQWKITFTR